MAISEAAHKSAKSPKKRTLKISASRRRSSHGCSTSERQEFAKLTEHEKKLMKQMFGYTPANRWDTNLFYIAEQIEARPSQRRLSLGHLAELDQIADYEIPGEGKWPPLPCGMDPDDYGIGTTEIEDFLANLEWWINLSVWIPGTRTREMLPEIFSAYTAAIDDSVGYEGFKALRAYRLYTRHVCKCAQEAWPEANLRVLLMQM